MQFPIAGSTRWTRWMNGRAGCWAWFLNLYLELTKEIFSMAKVNVTPRTTKGLCNCLFDELDMIRNGKSNPHQAAAVAKLAVQIINTKRLEIEAACLTK